MNRLSDLLDELTTHAQHQFQPAPPFAETRMAIIALAALGTLLLARAARSLLRRR